MEAPVELQNTLQFLSRLEHNNSLEWMNENKEDYLTAKNSFICVIQKLAARISEIDSSIPCLEAKDLIFKLILTFQQTVDISTRNRYNRV